MTKILNRMIDELKSGETLEEKIGVEFEHFIINRHTLESIAYDGPGGGLSVVKALIKKDWCVDYEETLGIFSIEKHGIYISFEPGGQLEISLPASHDISNVDEMYQRTVCEIKSCLPKSHTLVALGYHPKSGIEDLPLVKKERYQLMYDYLHKKGKYARHMMKGSASTQVSIDYKDETDFEKKYRVANFLSPVLSYLFEASPVFEGSVYKSLGVRGRIWANMDPVRSKYPNKIMNESFDYFSYVNYLLTVPPVFVPSLGFTGDMSLGDLSEKYELNEEDVLHGMTMAFPDVRVKTYIEIRMMDSMPYPFNLAIPTLVKTLFYQPDLLDKYYQKSLKYTDEMLNMLDEKYLNDHREALEPLAKGLLDDVITYVADEDKKYLMTFVEFREANGHFVDYLKENYASDDFVDLIEGTYTCLNTMKK